MKSISGQLTLGIGGITGHYIVFRIPGGNNPPLLVMLFYSDSVYNRQWFFFCEQSGAWIALLSGLLSWIQKISASMSLKYSKKPLPTQARNPFTFQEISFFINCVVSLLISINQYSTRCVKTAIKSKKFFQFSEFRKNIQRDNETTWKNWGICYNRG